VAAFIVGDTSAVLDLSTPQLSNELAELDTRIHVVEGLIDAHSQLERVNSALQFARDRQTALVALQHEPFGYTRQQANAILDMPMSWQSPERRQRLMAERDELAARRAGLRERVSEVLALHWFG
jgi:DNA gyrase/topoisomerase IV subunit A